MKKIIKYTSITILGILLLLSCAVAIGIKIYVTKDRVIQLVEQNINARVEIQDISVPLWASLSGVTIKNLKVGYRDKQVKKEPSQRKPMGTSVIGFKEFNFKVAILKLITSFGKDFELRALLLTKPEARIILYPKGGTNLDALLAPPPGVAKKPKKEEKAVAIKKEEEKQEKPPKKPSEPFSIKSIDTVVRVGKVGLEKGNFSVNLKKFGNTIKLHDVNATITDVLIDPKDLLNKNRVKFNFSFSALLDESKKAKNAVRSFAIHFKANGRIQPFDPKTGKITEKARLKVGLLSGTKFTGLALLNKIRDKAKLLKKAGVNLDFLKNNVELNKDAIMDLYYRSGVVVFKSALRIDTNDFLIRLAKDSKMNVKTMNHNFTSDLVLNEKATKKIKGEVKKLLDKISNEIVKQSPAALRKTIKPMNTSSLSRDILAPAIDKKTKRFRLSVNSSGSFSDPNVKLTKPRLGDAQKEVKKILQKQLKNLKGVASKFVDKKVQEAKKEAQKKVQKEVKKEAKKVIKKLKLPF